jgi:hypothetical protein
MRPLVACRAALVLVLGACGGAPPPSPNPPPSATACASEACGPRLGMPAQRCSDGSMGGNTGRCIRQGDSCAWEIRECPSTAGGCVKTGCSGTLCAETGNDLVTTCEFRPEYACYGDASCERQPDGACGWTQTPELARCLANPPPLQ